MSQLIYIDMDGVLCDFEGAIKRHKKANPDIVYPQSVEGFYRGLKPIKGAISAMETLLKLENVQAYILTAPSLYNPLSYTEKRLWKVVGKIDLKASSFILEALNLMIGPVLRIL